MPHPGPTCRSRRNRRQILARHTLASCGDARAILQLLLLRACSLTAVRASRAQTRVLEPWYLVSYRSSPPHSAPARQNDERQPFSQAACSMSMANVRRLHTAALLVHLLTSASAIMGLRLAPSPSLPFQRSRAWQMCSSQPCPASHFTLLHVHTSHVAGHTLTCRGGPFGWPPSPSKSGRQSIPVYSIAFDGD